MRVLAIVVLTTGCGALFGLEPPTLASSPNDAPMSAADAPASCFDNMVSPGETDIDCGGICPACPTGKACVQNADCTTHLCSTKTCVMPKSCLELHDGGQLASGIYSIDPAGTGSFDVYCDQVSAGGGWTLIMKLASGTSELAFAAPQWNTTQTLNATDLAPNTAPLGSNAKLVAFNLVAGGDLRLQWLDPVHDFMYTSATRRTALQMFMGPEVKVVGDESDGCHGSLLDASPSYLGSKMRHATAHQFYGINGQDSALGNHSAMRFGFGSNDETNNVWNPHQGAGTDGSSLEWSGQTDCNACSCYGSLYTASPTSANLWIR